MLDPKTQQEIDEEYARRVREQLRREDRFAVLFGIFMVIIIGLAGQGLACLLNG